MGGDSHLLLRAAGRPGQPVHHAEADRVAHHVRPRERRGVRRARVRVLHPRGVRLVLPGLRRVLADLPRRDRHDLRAGVAARPRVPARRRHAPDLPRRRRAPLHGGHHHARRPPPRNRERILRDFLEYRRSAVQEGERGTVREYLIPPGAIRRASSASAALLAMHGIEVQRADEPIKLGNAHAAGGHVHRPACAAVRAAAAQPDRPGHPDGREVHEGAGAPPEEAPGDQIYDVTAWSLPLLFDVEVVTSAQADGGQGHAR